jgi:predicted Zn finger-like uncharacterized protein
MFLSCPQCDTKFKLPAEKLLPDGKKVRCASCSHTWFQEPLPETNDEMMAVSVEAEDSSDTASDDLDQSFEKLVEQSSGEEPSVEEENTEDDTQGDGGDFSDIPLAVRPRADEADMPKFDDMKNTGPIQPKLFAAAAALSVFLLIGLVLLMFRTQIVHAWPAANTAFSVIGMEPIVKGQGVVFNQLEASIEEEWGDEYLSIQGQIVNLKREPAAVPYISATLLDIEGNMLKQWLIEPPTRELGPEEVQNFVSKYKTHPDAMSVDLSFTLKEMSNKEADESDYNNGEEGGAEKEHSDDAGHSDASH